jgi:hypothetical protein
MITAKHTIIFDYELEMCWRVYVGVPLVHSVYSAASEGLKGKPITGPKLKKPPPSTLTHKTFYTGNRREVIGHVVFGL